MKNKQNEGEKNYDRAITLIQNQVQLFWLVFGAFLVTETVLLGGIASLAKDGVNLWAFFGAILGLGVCILWWGTFQYNHAFYKLRIEEAKQFEPTQGNFFLNGSDLINKKKPLKVIIPWHGLQPKAAISFLIIMFAIAFLSIAIANNCWK